MTYEEVIAGFRALQAQDFDLSNVDAHGMERLYELTRTLMTLPAPERGIPELYALMERLPESDLGSPGPLVHALEKLEGYEQELFRSVHRHPTPLSVWMVNRILNTELPEERRGTLLSLLEMATLHPAASAAVRADAEDFLRLQRTRH